ncbi:MAG: sigma-54 interaction domain-containing protein [bacterium]
MNSLNSCDYFSVILNSITDGVFTVDNNWRITFFNKAAEKITGLPGKKAIGKCCQDIFLANICKGECALKKTIKTGYPVVSRKINITRVDGKKIPVSISTAILRDKSGNIIGGVETFRDLSIIEELKKKVGQRYNFTDIISKNHRMQQIFKILPDIAQSDSTVLIEGASGTGKELVARAIHNLSSRKNGSFVAINCAGLPYTLLESELFGYKTGAFTGAIKDKQGRFDKAQGGTLFLDEIGEIPLAMQVKLLRVIQEKVFEPLGSVAPVKADIRIIAASNKNLQKLVSKNIFREDLYYRINVVNIRLPDLKERKEDIPLLVNHFIQKFNCLKNKNIKGVSAEAMSILLDYQYPGNIRELENIIEHAFVLCATPIIDLCHLPENLKETQMEYQFFPKSVQEMEKYLIVQALKKNSWNRRATAKSLNIHKSTLYRKINNLKIQLPFKGRRSIRTNSRIIKTVLEN